LAAPVVTGPASRGRGEAGGVGGGEHRQGGRLDVEGHGQLAGVLTVGVDGAGAVGGQLDPAGVVGLDQRVLEVPAGVDLGEGGQEAGP
jgi:hypothetical protein